MKKTIANIHNFFIPSKYKENEQEYRKVRILINTTLITALFAFFFLGNTILFEMPTIRVIMIICCVVFLFLAFLIKWNLNKSFVLHVYVLTATTCTFFDSFYSGGLYSFNVVWYILGPVCAVLLGTVKQGWFWAVINCIAVLILGYLQYSGYLFKMDINPQFKDIMYLNSFIGAILIVFMVTVVMENASLNSLIKLEEKNQIIATEKKRSDDLLLNILPEEVVQELKETGQSRARLFNNASVLFTDFVNFTALSEHLEPEELVKEIDVCFGAFDTIIEKYNLEKIKTIGDAYLAVCGMPQENVNHAKNCVLAALDIIDFMAKRKNGNGVFDIRIGINSGPVIAGIVGSKKFAYDIWGDTVNTAARMESNSEVNKINISETTFALVKNEFRCESRGKLLAKNKGELQMYFVQR